MGFTLSKLYLWNFTRYVIGIAYSFYVISYIIIYIKYHLKKHVYVLCVKIHLNKQGGDVEHFW